MNVQSWQMLDRPRFFDFHDDLLGKALRGNDFF
jgi:hypothetical protein